MNTLTKIMSAFPDDIAAVDMKKGAELHGQVATKVIVSLKDGRSVTGMFATEGRPGFGGIDFETKKDIAGLMISKVGAVLRGTAE